MTPKSVILRSNLQKSLACWPDPHCLRRPKALHQMPC